MNGQLGDGGEGSGGANRRGYDVVLADGDALVLAHYGAGDCGHAPDPRLHARQHAERFAAQLRRLLRRTRTGP